MSFYDYGLGNYLTQNSSKPFKLQFYLKCILNCIESCERQEVIDSYIMVLDEAQHYLRNMIEVVFEGKKLKDYEELNNDYSYVISGLNVEDLSRAKEVLEGTIEEIERLRKHKCHGSGGKERLADTKIFLDRVVSSNSLCQMFV